MDVSPETKLNKQITSYNSFAGSPQSADGSSTQFFTCDLNKNHDLHCLTKDIPLKEFVSGSPELIHPNLSNLKETDRDGSSRDSLTPLYAGFLTFAFGLTLIFLLHISLGSSLVTGKGLLVSDHKLCTALGQKVLEDHGSSVDAAIAAALCLGVVHPHVSGVGGGGLMLVHDINQNETRVIDFQGTAPETLPEETLQNVSEPEAGRLVGVPGMLRGLHHAHSLYGRLLWEDVVARAAAVAREGFNVSSDLAEAILNVQGEKLQQRFREMFFPRGQALLPGSFLRMPNLADALEADLSNCYDGNFSQEIVDEVQANGGVLSREDLCNYTVEVEQPVKGFFEEFTIQVPPPPSAAAALILALSVLEGFHLNQTNNQTNHWIDEVLTGALAMASGFGDAKHNSSVTELLSDMMSHAEFLRDNISDSHRTLRDFTATPLPPELQAGRVVVMGPDDFIVSVASSLSRPFGSRLVTRSGVILNSLILDFSRSNKTRTNQRNNVQPGKRPLSFLMPTIVVPTGPKCGLYVALSSSGGRECFSATAQVLINELYNRKEKNVSLSLNRLHPPHRPLVDSEFPAEAAQVFRQESRAALGVRTSCAVQGILRSKDIIQTISIPQLSDD